MTEAQDPQANPQTGAEARQMVIQKIYVKDVSFETPHSPAVFTEEWKPDVNFNLSTDAKPLGQDVYNVVLSVTATVKVGDNTAFLVEVQQAGIFGIKGFADAELKQVLGSYCPNLLFPYAREAVSDLVTRGGFPQFLLAPVNFDALYAKHLQQQQGEAEEATTH